ncbi:MAG: hypothetical protein V4722_10365 [Bacteroidota bacterium]
MIRLTLAFVLLFTSLYCEAQITRLMSPTGALTPHWKQLAVPVKPVWLKGRFYTKLDDDTFIATNGTPTGTIKLVGFTDIKSIAYYIATSRYLYYTSYTGGKVRLTRYDPETGVHAALFSGTRQFAESDETVLIFSVFENKLVVSSWLWNASANKTFTYVYAIHDADAVPNAYLLAASTNANGILDGPAGLSDGQVITRYDMKTENGPSNKQMYVFDYVDSVAKGYRVKKTYDFAQIGHEVNSLVTVGNDVLIILVNKKKAQEKLPNATSLWLLRNKTTKKICDLPEVKSNSFGGSLRAGDYTLLRFDEVIYSYNMRTGLVKTAVVFKPDESLGCITSHDYLKHSGDSVWFRMGTRQAGGTTVYRLQVLSLKANMVSQPAFNLPARFSSSFLFMQPNLQHLYFYGNYLYYFEAVDGADQLFQLSMHSGEVKKIVLPQTPTSSFIKIADVIQVGGSLLLKAYYKTKKETILETFLYQLP